METILTLQEAARYLKLAPITIYRKARRREIPAAKVGKSWRFHRSQLESWLRHQAESEYRVEEIVTFRHLSTRETEAVKKYIELLRGQFSEVTKVILYGSKARGDFNAYSDIDLLLLVERDMTDSWKKELAAWTQQFNLDNDVLIQSILLSDKEWVNPSFRNFLLVETIKREGIPLDG